MMLLQPLIEAKPKTTAAMVSSDIYVVVVQQSREVKTAGKYHHGKSCDEDGLCAGLLQVIRPLFNQLALLAVKLPIMPSSA
jgi:hypothetical protein